MTIDIIKNENLEEEVHATKLDNGLQVFFMPKKGYVKKYAVFATNYGSNDNKFIPIGKNDAIEVPEGIAHFLEHKLFEEEEGNIFNEFSKLGSYVNAYTNFNQTAYLFSCSDRFFENLELLVRFVQSPYFTDENVTKEKGIIGQEIRMYDDNPNWKVFFNCLRGMYVVHPVKTDIAGTVESIDKITKETLLECYNTFYHPSNMALFIVGDIDFEKALEVINKNLKRDVNQFKGDIQRIYEEEPKKINEALIEESLSVSTPLFNFGFKDLDIGFDGKPLLKKQIETNILLDMMFDHSSEFYQKLYEEGLINSSFGTQYIAKKDYGHAIIAGESANPKLVMEKINQYIEQIRESGFSEDNFIRNQKKHIGYHLMDFNSIEYIANSFISYHFNQTSLMDYLDVLNHVTFKDVTERFKRLFKQNNYAVSIINPK